MALLLWGAGLVALLSGEPTLGIVIWVVVLVNAGFSFWQEYRAEQAMESLSKLLPAYARVIREGDEQQIEAQELVPGRCPGPGRRRQHPGRRAGGRGIRAADEQHDADR